MTSGTQRHLHAPLSYNYSSFTLHQSCTFYCSCTIYSHHDLQLDIVVQQLLKSQRFPKTGIYSFFGCLLNILRALLTCFCTWIKLQGFVSQAGQGEKSTDEWHGACAAAARIPAALGQGLPRPHNIGTLQITSSWQDSSGGFQTRIKQCLSSALQESISQGLNTL